MGSRILIVEDESRISEPLARALESRGFEADIAPDGGSAIAQIAGADLILLDLNLPDIDGLDLCNKIRELSSSPLMIVSARSGIGDKVAGLELGADDYVTKPFVLDELVARIRAQLRRGSATSETKSGIEIGEIRVEPSARRAWKGGDELELSPKEFDLLELLMARAGQVVKREDAIDEVWDENWFGSTKTLDVHIRWLRQKIEDDPSNPRYINTVRRVGFRFASQAEIDAGENQSPKASG